MFDDDDQPEDRNFFQRHRDLSVAAGVVLLCAGAILGGEMFWKKNASPIRPDDFTMIVLPLPVSTPTPRPLPTPEVQPTPEHQEDKMVVQQPVQNETKSEAPKAKVPDAPAPLGTSIAGPGGGPDLGLGLGLGGGGGFGNGVGGGGSKYGWYASQVQNVIVDAVRNNPHTQRATMDVIVCIWPDSTGRVAKARIVDSAGNSPLDDALKNDVLTGLQLTEPPPSDMPLPIVIHLCARLPG